MQTQRHPLHRYLQYLLLAVLIAAAYLLIPGTDVSWSAGVIDALTAAVV